jgi:hypothetical protein
VHRCRDAPRGLSDLGVEGCPRKRNLPEPTNGVVVFNLTRVARDKYDHFALRSHLQSLGISLRSATESTDDTSTGKLMEGVLAAFAQFDNDVRSDRTRAGMKAALELGRWVLRTRPDRQLVERPERLLRLLPLPPWLRARPESPLRRSTLAPDKRVIEALISPDGRHVVYTTGQELWIQDLNRDEPRKLAEEDGIGGLCWSPRSDFVVFAKWNVVLKKISVQGGPIVTLWELPGGISPKTELELGRQVRCLCGWLPAEAL